MQHTIRSLLQILSSRLKAAEIDSPLFEAQVLLSHCMQSDRAYLLTWPDQLLSNDIYAQAIDAVARRINGEPIAYITGQREFYGLSFAVTSDVLIPRPETEMLVDLALDYLPPNGQLLDLGTGSGAIAVAIAHTRPDVGVTAGDISAAALTVAAGNAEKHSVNVQFIQSDWFTALPQRNHFDLIVSNPPYIDAGHPYLRQTDIRFEPQLALTPGTDSLEHIRHLIQTAPAYLKSDGWLFIEHGYDQAQALQQLFNNPAWQRSKTITDLSGNPRVSMAQATA